MAKSSGWDLATYFLPNAGDEDEITSTVDPWTTQIWTARVHLYVGSPPHMYIWPCDPWVSHLQIQPALDQKQYFHILKRGFPTAGGKYCFPLGLRVFDSGIWKALGESTVKRGFSNGRGSEP